MLQTNTKSATFQLHGSVFAEKPLFTQKLFGTGMPTQIHHNMNMKLRSRAQMSERFRGETAKQTERAETYVVVISSRNIRQFYFEHKCDETAKIYPLEIQSNMWNIPRCIRHDGSATLD